MKEKITSWLKKKRKKKMPRRKRENWSRTLILILINVNVFLFIFSVLAMGFALDTIGKDLKVTMMHSLENNLVDETAEDRDKIFREMEKLSNLKVNYSDETRKLKRTKLINDINENIEEIYITINEDEKELNEMKDKFAHVLDKTTYVVSRKTLSEIKEISSKYDLIPSKREPVYISTTPKNSIDKKYARYALEKKHDSTSLDDITIPSGLTGEELEHILTGNLKGLGEAYAKMEKEKGINSIFAINVAKLESGHGLQIISRNNVYNIYENGEYKEYDSALESIMDFGNHIQELYIKDRNIKGAKPIAFEYFQRSPILSDNLVNMMLQDLVRL